MIGYEELRSSYEAMLASRENFVDDAGRELEELNIEPDAFVGMVQHDVGAAMENLEKTHGLGDGNGDGNGGPISLITENEIASYFAAQFHDGFICGFLAAKEHAREG